MKFEYKEISVYQNPNDPKLQQLLKEGWEEYKVDVNDEGLFSVILRRPVKQ